MWLLKYNILWNNVIEKKPKGVHFSPKRTKGVHFCYPHFVRKRLIPQIRVRMQANDGNENEDGAVSLTSISIHRCRFLKWSAVKGKVRGGAQTRTDSYVRAPNAKRCGVCQRFGHNERTCEYYEVWSDWKDPNDLLFRNMFSHFLNRNRNRARRPQ